MNISRTQYHTERHGAKLRRARVTHRCDQLDDHGVRCSRYINRGDMYLDTGVVNQQSRNSHATLRICEQCANEEITV